MKSVKTVEDRFWEKVDKSGDCWIWTAGCVTSKSTPSGGTRAKPPRYGKFNAKNPDGSVRQVLAHRFSVELSTGTIPSGMVVDHTCYNTLCVNPEHLRVTTYQKNSENRSGVAAHSKTGARGVGLSRGRPYAYCTYKGKRHYFGTYDTVEEAAKAARQGRLSLMSNNDADK